MKKIFTYCALIISIMFTACEIDEFDTFGEEDFLGIDIDDNHGELIDGNGYLIQLYTFALEKDPTTTEQILNYSVKIAGMPDDVDRPFAVKLTDSLTTAIEGTHFEILEEDNIISAGETTGTISIKVMRTATMKTESYKIALTIIENDYMKAGPDKKLIITVSDKFEKPLWWYSTYSESNIGVFSVRKAQLWFKFHDLYDGTDPWLVEPFAEWAENYYTKIWEMKANRGLQMENARLFVAWLNQGDENGDPYYDENGILVVDTITK